MIDMTIDRCHVCGLNNTYLYLGQDANGDIFTFDVCDKCEQKAMDMMSEHERIESLGRWTFNDKR